MWTEEKLNKLLTEPSPALVEDIRKIEGDIMILGAGGKMGSSLCALAKNAVSAAGLNKRIIAVSRFSDENAVGFLEESGVDIIKCDLLDREQLSALPETENIIFMAGRKFGTYGNEWKTWGMNATLPVLVCEKFKGSRFVVFSSGNIYPIVPVHTGGCTEETKVAPIGEYTTSCLARERAFEYAAHKYGSEILIYRLNYAVDLKYGVLYDIAYRVLNRLPVQVTTPAFNCIWQGSANEMAIRGLLHVSRDVSIMNVTGPETLSVRGTAQKFGQLLGVEPTFEGEESNCAYLSNSAKAIAAFGYPAVSAETLIKWQAEWILGGGKVLNKPTHFEERDGTY